MAKAISETERRRAIQQTYNEKHGVVPTAAGKKASNSILSPGASRKLKQDGPDADLVEVVGGRQGHGNDPDAGGVGGIAGVDRSARGEDEEAAKKLDFEEAPTCAIG